MATLESKTVGAQQEVSFSNFKPSDDLRVYANGKLMGIMERAPDGATSVATMERLACGFRCRLEIASQLGLFSAEVLGNDPKTAIDYLEQKIMREFSEWHHKRFSTEKTGTIDVKMHHRPLALIH